MSTYIVSKWVGHTFSKLVNFECVGVLVCCSVGMCWSVGALEALVAKVVKVGNHYHISLL